MPDQSYRIVLAIVAAAVLACAFTIFTAMAEPVEASAQIAEGGGSAGLQCSQRAWPYYEANCLRDLQAQYGVRKSLRIVTTERWSD